MTDIWAGTFGPRDATIALVGDCWGTDERDAGRPFVGPAGTLLADMLAEVGIERDKCFLTSVVNARPPANDFAAWFDPGPARGPETVGGLRPQQIVRDGLNALYAQLDAVQPKVVLALGNYALWALTRHAGSVADGPRPRVPNGVGDWRGSQVFRLAHGLSGRDVETTVPVLPLVHPQTVLRDWSQRAWFVHDVRTRVPLALRGEWEKPDYDFRVLLEFEDAKTTLSELLGLADAAAVAGRTMELSCDLETLRSSLITCVGIATSDSHAISMPLVRVDPARKGAVESFWPVAQEAQLTVLLARLLNHPSVGWIGQNFLYDRAFLWEWWRVEPRLSWDTLCAQNLLLPGTPKDLGTLSSMYCAHHRFWKRDSRGWEDDESLGLEAHLLYNAEDCARTFEIALAQRKALAEIRPDAEVTPGGRLELWPHELEKIRLAWEMQRNGMVVDQVRRNRLAMDLIEARSALSAWLETIVPQSLLDAEGVTPASGTPWFASPRQTAVLFYEVLGLRAQRNRKTGAVSTDDEALNTLREQHPRLKALFDTLLEYRSLGVYFATFVEAKLEADGKFRSSFNPAGTVTFRFSSSKNPFRRGGNFQNLPGTEDE